MEILHRGVGQVFPVKEQWLCRTIRLTPWNLVKYQRNLS